MSSTNNNGKGNILITYLFKGDSVVKQVQEEAELKVLIEELLASKRYKFAIADDDTIDTRLIEGSERILELEKQNEILRDSLEWLQREINNLGKIIKTENGDKLILERPEKTKYVIASAINFTK